MDKQLVDNLIKVVLDDKGHTNSYSHLEDLILTLSDEEIDYFLESCDEDVFTNFNLSWSLARTIPQKMKEFAISYVEGKLNIIDLMEQSLKKEHFKGRISQELYDETIREYNEVRVEADRFLRLYMYEIDKEIKKQ